ncbi:probable RNA polymerase II nuclear localization protein SLC7A6OS isoform X1 [Carcharodon carcharias]|uniref:probable RNA polymerase II nuclear localization protein SLC7A6OS isoform X1 n=1 Tax=Carcharodon carcharias TaxID=13397 RepID=UPI001B7DD4F8|nr:probable RNA polymerase II nuclear localization protein SLC7A6OS isoform X1 [Carcharodon carcharias]
MAAAVLRVKRKRGEEPAEALLLACKRLRTGGESGEPGPGEHVVRTLFKLAATVGARDDPVQRHVRETISKDKALLALKPSETSVQRIQLYARASRQTASQENRYKVIASHRRNFSTEASEPQSGDVKHVHQTGTKTSGAQCEQNRDSWKKAYTASGSNKDGVGPAAEIQVFDIVQHDEQLEKDEEGSRHNGSKDSGPGQNDPQEILCNSVRMIREKLTVSDSGPGAEHRENMEEYVYDIYCTDSYFTGGGIQDILSVVPCHEENELVGDEVIADEAYEDEDDENEENNWRNDYPDEDSFEKYWNSEEDSEEEDGNHRLYTKDDD